MTYVVRAKPHFKVVFACGHVKAQCACRSHSERWKATAVVDEQCPACARDESPAR